MADQIRASSEYGIVIRQAALVERNISMNAILEAFEGQSPLDGNAYLISFGPSFGKEALDEFSSRLEKLGLLYFDDFFTVAYDVPAWCSLYVGLNREIGNASLK